MAITFKEIRKYLSRVTRLSICFEDGSYDNYSLLSDIPEGKYDELFVFGVGMVDVEFSLDVYREPKEFPQRISQKDGYFMAGGLEIVLHKIPRDIERKNEEKLTFGDLRNYLQIGRNFSMITKEGWDEEYYEWLREIPEKYNKLYVYGIGMASNPDETYKLADRNIVDSALTKNLRIVVSECPID